MKSKRIDEETKERYLKSLGRCLLPAIFVLVATGACGVQSDLTNLKNDTTHLRAQMQVMREEVALQEDIDSLKVHIVRLEALVRDQTEELLRMRADMGQRVGALENQLQVLTTRITESDRQFSALVRRLESLQVQLSVPARPDTTAAQTGSFDPGELYDLALRDYQRGSYDVAVRQFTQYIEYFPDSDLADDAQFYIGDSYYTQSLYTQALDAYEMLLDTYPGGSKVPATLLKIAFIKVARKEPAEARSFLERVIGEFPDSEEAQLARMRLDLMPED
ncbi:MAG: tol-pal system protein YbgF [Gemmatimonadetes bacterium]|nr:tol-pal system protein YbgF [Gemmatimonadota bacterium]MYH17876.1 tol-pal system protein YbgF [Gemmatimonadota bacterium]MYK99723.1 tol-pal system protein YbgF [Gemmatimonadota bacterium]